MTAVFRALHLLRCAMAARARDARRRFGVDGPLVLVAYEGFGTTERAFLRARVLEDRSIEARAGALPLAGAIVQTFRRYATRPVEGVPVTVAWEGGETELISDSEGFTTEWVAPAPGADALGWGVVRVELPGESDSRACTELAVRVVDPSARFGVISDVDDTVLETHVPNLAKRAEALFLSDWHPRRAFPGTADLYRALESGGGPGAANPIFYVSSTPWNLHDHVARLLDQAGVPRGPLLLRDWGLGPNGFAPDGSHAYKQDVLRSILDAFPTLPFVLVGDTGQQDPMHYAAVARTRPGRIRAVLLRDIARGKRHRDRVETALGALGAKIPVHAFRESTEALAWARTAGLASD